MHTVLSGALKHALRMELVYRNPGSLVSVTPGHAAVTLKVAREASAFVLNVRAVP